MKLEIVVRDRHLFGKTSLPFTVPFCSIFNSFDARSTARSTHDTETRFTQILR